MRDFSTETLATEFTYDIKKIRHSFDRLILYFSVYTISELMEHFKCCSRLNEKIDGLNILDCCVWNSIIDGYCIEDIESDEMQEYITDEFYYFSIF